MTQNSSTSSERTGLDLNDKKLLELLELDLIDGYDEELEMEIEDRPYTNDPQERELSDEHRANRRIYFQELFRA